MLTYSGAISDLQLLLLFLSRRQQRGQLLRLVLRLEVRPRRQRRRGRDDCVSSSSGVGAAATEKSWGI